MDLVLRNAAIVDGTGRPAVEGDVAIANGRIAALGRVDGSGRDEINVRGAVVAPGFIDVHTHYDAQALWDPLLTPSIHHGVTTVIAGNCGFTLAPLSEDPADTDYLIRMLSRVEGMPLAALREGVKPDWRSFGEYLARLDGHLALNTAFLVGHSTLRRVVMGERALTAPANAGDLQRMKNLLRESIAAGGVGFSTTISGSHVDLEGNAVPSRQAGREEMLALCAVAGEYPGTWLELVPGVALFTDRECTLMTEMSLAAGRAVNWNLLSASRHTVKEMQSQLQASDYARERGARIYALVSPMVPKAIMSLASGFMMDLIPNWSEVLALPLPERRKAFADRQVRERLRAGLEQIPRGALAEAFKQVGDYTIEGAALAHNRQWIGQSIASYAQTVGKQAFDAFLDLSVEEELRLAFTTKTNKDDPESWRLRASAWKDERCIVGGSDAGAHLDMLNSFAFASEFFHQGVRRHGLLSVEEAVRLITSVPAERFGLTGRGRLTEGACADIVVFDPDRIASGPFVMKPDLPCGESRVYSEAVGIPHVIVNGVPVVRDGAATGRAGGRVLRSGRDTHTVPN
jgi:N-acyl-D-aspartate/D-glutamate deacylase